ncbi:Uncharacterised protein [Actinobacillus equuli]|nr:Uncharacterised protein [Actinobacillus equuli]
MANVAQQVLTNLRVQTTYKLLHPIVSPSGETITELQVRRIKAKDLREFEQQHLMIPTALKWLIFTFYA